VGPGNEILVRKFKGSDLHGNTDIRLELASGIASTNAGRADLVMQLLQYSFFDNPAIQPDLQREILKMLGLSSFEQSTNLHKIRAEYENSILTGDDEAALMGVALPGPIPAVDDAGNPVLDENGQPQMIHLFPASHDPVFPFDRHDLHIEVLNKLIFSREFRKMPSFKKERVLGHYDMHTGALEAQIAEQQAAAAEAEAASKGENTSGPRPESPNAGGEFEATPYEA
jgi:hypothetical protein